MNEIVKQIKNRKSVRQYIEKDISEEVTNEILKAAIEAPSAGNQQLYSIIKVTDQKIKDELAILCDNQPFIAKAPLVLVFCSDYKKWYDLYDYGNCNPRELGYGDMLLSISDTVIAAQNTVVAAESFGVGSCYIGDILENYEKVKALLKLPKNVLPITMVVYGYPTENQVRRNKPKRPSIKTIVHENTYKDLKDEELVDLVRHNIGNDTFENWIGKFCKRKYNSKFSEEMNRSSKKYVDEFKKDDSF